MPSSETVHYRIYCETEAAWKYWRLKNNEAAPTTCPTDTGHTVTAESVVESSRSGPKDVNLYSTKKDQANQLVVANALGTDGGQRTITHNFCDPQTWWHESTEHVAQASTSGDQLTYDITNHDKLIDVRHGRITFEDDITVATVAPNGNTMTNIVPTVLLDAVALDQALEDATTGDDRYTIDYAAGTVTFAVARGGGVAVTVSFRKSGSSKYTIQPKAGHKFVLQDAEVDCSEDIDMTSKFTVDTHGSHTSVTGGVVASLSKRIYKTMHDFQAAARRFWGPIPANFGATGGVASPKWTFEWQYSRSDALYDTANYRDVNEHAALVTLNKVEVSIDGDVAYGGCCLTVTMYGYQEAEAA
jgi:hypothetical protein